MKRQKLEYKFELQWIEALLKGKRLYLNDEDYGIQCVFYPPQGGICLTHEELSMIKHRLSTQYLNWLINLLENKEYLTGQLKKVTAREKREKAELKKKIMDI